MCHFRYTALLTLLLASSAGLFAQSESASIVGTITDPSSAVVPGASVSIRNNATNATVTVKSGPSGNFTSPPLAAGAFTVTVEQEGFRRMVQGINLDVDQHARLDIALQPGAVNESVTVEAQGTLLETQSAELGNVRTGQAINDLPLNGRDFVVLTYLSPGASSSGSGFTQARGASNQLGLQGVSVNGIRNGNNTYNFDGIHSQDNEYAVMILLPPQDFISEFKMETSGRDATSGRTGGALINLVTKSGGNDFHGTAFEFFRNSDLDARNFFDPVQKPAFHQNQFGGSIGGRIKRDKTFFYADIQKAFTIQGQSFLQTVPTDLERAGNFSQLAAVLYNPYTTTTTNGVTTRLPFAGNIIPQSMWSPIGAGILGLYPHQDLPGLANNYSSTPARTLAPEQGDIRIDHRISDYDTLFTRFSISEVNPYNPGYFPQFAGGPIYPGSYESQGSQIVLGYTHIFTPTLLAEFRAGYSRLANTGVPPNVPTNFMDSLGIPGIDGYGTQAAGVAAFTITGADLVGGSGNIPFIKVTNNYQTSYHFTWTHGKQTIKWGYDLFRRQMNTVQAGSPSGAFTFSGQFTQNPQSAGGTGSGIADALLGLDSTGSLSVWQEVGTRRWEHGLYFQDDYRVTNKLTINAGLRWEAATPWTEEHNRLADFVPSANTVLPVGSPQVPGNSIYFANWKDFGPRFGLSYAINPKTVLRAGFGYFYDFTSISVNILGTENPPFSGTLSITNNTTATNLASNTPLSQGFLPYQSFGSFNPAGLSISYWLPHQPDTTVQQRNISLQRQLPMDTVLTVAYVGTRGEHLTVFPNINAPVPGAGAAGPRRAYPTFSTITTIEHAGDSYYNGLQVTAEKRFSKGLAFLAAFSWAHSIDELSTQANGTPQNVLCLVCDRGNSDFDIRRSLVLSWSYELPLGEGKWIGHDWKGAKQAVFGGWKLNSINTFQDGSPFSITTSSNSLGSGAGTQRANYVGGSLLVPNPGPSSYWNTAAFTTPGLYQYGNSGRNNVIGPGTEEVDLSLFKNVPLSFREGMRAEFRVEAFNLFNKPQFDNPGENGSGNGGGSIGLPTSGTLNYAGNPAFFQRTSREIQLAVKFYF